MKKNNVNIEKKKKETSKPSSLNNTKISNLQELREDDFPINEELIDANERQNKISNKKKEAGIMKEENKKNNKKNSLQINEDVASNDKEIKSNMDAEAKKPEMKFQKLDIPTEGTDPKGFFDVTTQPAKFKNEDGKTAISNLQKLREQIQAQKKLERKLMETEAVKTQTKDKQLLSKLSQLESLVEVEEDEEENEELILLERENENLNKKIEELNNRFNRLISLKYNDIPVIKPDTLEFNFEIVDTSNHDDINDEIKRLEHALDELNNSHTSNIQEVLLTNKEELKNLNSKVEDLNKQLKAAKSSLNKEKKTVKTLEEQIKSGGVQLIDDSKVEELKSKLDEYKTNNSKLNKELDSLKKLDVKNIISERAELLKQTRKLEKQVDKLNEKLTIITDKAKEEKAIINEELKIAKRDLKKSETKITKLEDKVNSSKESLKEMKNEISRLTKETAELDQVRSDLKNQTDAFKDLESRNKELENLISKNDVLVSEFKEQIKMTRSELKKANNAKNRLDKQVKEAKENLIDNDALNKDIEDKNQKIDALNKTINDLELKIKKLVDENKQIQELANSNKLLNDNLNNLKSDLSSKELELKQAVIHKEELTTKLTNKEEELNNLNLQLEALNKELKDIKDSALSDDEKEEQIIKLENQNTDLIAELDLKNDEIDELNEKIQVLEVEIKGKTINEKEASALTVSINELQEKFNHLNEEHSNLVNDYENKLDEISELKEKIDEYEFLLQEEKSKVGIEPEVNSDIQNKVDDLNIELDSKNEIIQSLKYDIENLEIEIKKLKEYGNDNIILRSQVKDLDTRLISKNQEVKNLEEKISSLYEKMSNKDIEFKSALNNKDEEFQALFNEQEDKFKTLESINNDLETKLSEMNDKHLISTEDYSALVQKVEELNSQKDVLNKELLEMESKYQNKISDIQDYNRSNNEKISILERNLNNAISDKNDFIIELERTKKLLSEEKFIHHDEISRLRREIDHKSDDIERLKQEISNASQKRLDTTINNLVNELERKTNFGYQQMNPMMFPNFYNTEKIQKDYEKELADKEVKIKELETKQSEIESQMKDKILVLENQLRGMENLIKSGEKEDSESVYQENLKTLKKELEDYKKEIKEDVQRQIESRTNIYLGSDSVQNIIKKYTSEKELITYRFNSELNRLEAQKKFTDIPAEMAIINEKIDHLKKEYKKLLDENDYRFRNEITKDSKDLYDEVEIDDKEDITVESSEPTDSDIPDYVEEFESYNVNLLKNDDKPDYENEYQESDSSEPIDEINDVIDNDDDDLYEDALPDFDELANLTENISQEPIDEKPKSTIVYSRNKDENDDFRIVGKVGQDYLSRIGNTRKLRLSLQEKQREEISKYNSEYQMNISLQEELQNKINLVRVNIDSLEENYNSSKYHSPEQTKEYENKKTKLYFELENRQEKLRKHKEEDIRKLELRHKNIMMNLNEQIAQLDAEEKSLKEAYLNKKQKDLSKQNRDTELLTKLEEERKALATEQESLHIEESGEEVSSDKPEPSRVIVSRDEKRKSILDNSAKENEQLSTKEKELVALFKKYQSAESKMRNEISEVKLYSDNQVELNGFKVLYDLQISQIQELKNDLENSSNKKEINDKISELTIKSNNLKNKIDYRIHQLEGLKTNKVIGEYAKLTSKLEDIKKLLVKYSKKRNL